MSKVPNPTVGLLFTASLAWQNRNSRSDHNICKHGHTPQCQVTVFSPRLIRPAGDPFYSKTAANANTGRGNEEPKSLRIHVAEGDASLPEAYPRVELQ